jgi:large subunit ribosomal protein L21
MKYAIVESGGKQYKAVEGTTIEVDKMPLEVGTKIDLNDVLLISDEGEIVIGKPVIEGAKVAATVVAQFKAPKVIVFKYKSRQRYRVKQGHRQQYTRLMIEEILSSGGKKTSAKKEEPKAEEKTEAKPKTKSAAKPKAKSAAKPKTKSAAKPKTKSSAKPKTKTAAKKTATKKTTKKAD